MGLGAGTVYLLALGTKGNDIAQVLSLTAAMVSLLVTVYEKRWRPRAARPPVRLRWRRLWVALVAAVLACACTVVVWRVSGRNNLNVTVDMTEALPAVAFGPGTELTLPVPGDPPRRRWLALTLVLENVQETGNCAGPAILTLQPTVDGVAAATVQVRSGKEAKLSLAGATRRAEVKVGVRRDDSECSYRLVVQQAVLFN
ncbi:hypothetical protein OG271_19945 [Micromonospora rifamycinica]|uniref:hypothetical protein n=1 Tax=Micromonospora rifamycinica TaxID=291594 RepID=UPI002E2B89DE|nr:hypothetical protein [Micromonospora rifamycinica]